MITDNLRAALYARVSGEQQEKEDTIASQLEAVTRRTTASEATSWPDRHSSDFGTKPPPEPSTASICSIRIDFHASMPIRS